MLTLKRTKGLVVGQVAIGGIFFNKSRRHGVEDLGPEVRIGQDAGSLGWRTRALNHHKTGKYEHGAKKTDHHLDRKSTRLNFSHLVISYAVFCLKKKDTEHYVRVLDATPPALYVSHCLRARGERTECHVAEHVAISHAGNCVQLTVFFF